MRLLGVGILLAIAVSSALAQIAPPPNPPSAGEKKKAPEAEPVVRKDVPDPCLKKKCGMGEDCRATKKDPTKAECVCIESCTDREFPDPLCTDKNATFNTICEFEREMCLCRNGKPCKPPGTGTFIVYYSECQSQTCNRGYDMVDYANRLAQWFRDTHAARSMIPVDYETNEGELMQPLSANARRVSSAMYNAKSGNNIYVSWWFCDLDKNNNKKLDKREISMLTRALMPNEQCIQDFLSSCDKDGDTKITETEWHAVECFNATVGKKSCADIYKLSSYI